MGSMNSNQWGLLIILSLFWGGSFFFIEIALRDFQPFTLVFLRISIAALILVGVVYFSGKRLPISLKTWKGYFVLGLLNNVIPFTLIAGLFLSNFPEALASSANMRLQDWSRRNIFLMWFSLMVITAIGAGLGYLLASELNPAWLIFAEGLAAGAMLTMIASAMIPEAVHMGSASAVGLSTLAGFLAAISFKLLE